MSHQYRLGNGLNEDNNPVADVRRLRYLLAMHFSSIATNNRGTTRRSGATTNLSILEHINLHRLRENTNTVIGHGGDHYRAPIILPTTTTTITNYNDNHSSSSSSSLHPRLFGSTSITTNRGNNNNMLSSLDFSPMLHPNIRGQPAGFATDIYNINDQRSGAIENSSNNSDPIMNNSSTNNNVVGTIITTATATVTTATAASTRIVDPSQSLSFKRSRSSDQFSRGESSGQSFQPVGISSKRQIIPHICLHQDIQSMCFANSSTSQMYYNGNSDISNMLNQHMVNQATAEGAEPSSINTTQSHINNLTENHGQTGFLPSRINTTQSYINSLPENRGQTGFVGDLPSHSNYINESIDNTRFSFLPLQDHPSFNFIDRRYEPRAASASSFYTRATTEGSLGTTQASTPFHIYNNFISSATSGGGSSSSTQSTGWGHNDLNNYNNNFDFFDSVQRENDDVLGHNSTNVQEHVRVLPSDRLNQFQATTLVPVRPSSFVPPQQPLSTSDPSSSNYLLSPPPSPSGLGNLQISSTLTRSVTQFRRRRHNRILILNSRELRARELRAERTRLRREIRNSLRRLRNAHARQIEALFERVDVGLTEDDILTFIQQKTFQTNYEETNTNNQACTICQEDFVDEERIGIINCKHMYHFDCIKQWLMLKNLCPICKHTALKIDQED